MEAIHYKGWIIIEETDPWAIKYGSNYRFFPEGEEGNGEVIRNSVTIEEAKDEISEIVFTKQYGDNWIVNKTCYSWLSDAMRYVAKTNAIPKFNFNAP